MKNDEQKTETTPKSPNLVSRILNPRADLSKLRQTRPTSGARGRSIRPHHVLGNTPLLIGGLIVLFLLAGVMFGPLLAPDNPYLRGRRIFEYVDGVYHRPPFPPSPDNLLGTDELGRDMLSLLLYGMRNTLVAAAFITMARLVLGLVLGGVAGWNENKLSDRLVMGAVQVLASLPTLLIAMILILALDVRRGLPVFVVALCAVGWSEIAQYVRAEFIRIKREPYLDSGRVIGLNGLELAVRHVLPNILPALIVITLLELGAVLMILGELGFVGMYIGGGLTVQTGDTTSQRYFSVPEWGVILAHARKWAQSRPWMPIFPAIAFFLSVTGFNLLGEGLRRLIDRKVFNTALLLSWRVLLAGAIITAACVYVTFSLGPAPSYRQLARQVDESGMMRHVEFLGAPEMDGRVVGSPEAYQAAQYIKAELESYGLGTHVHETSATLVRPVELPTLALLDEDGVLRETFTRLDDYGESVESHGGSGQAKAPVTLVLFPPNRHTWGYELFSGLDLRGRIVMVLSSNAPPDFVVEALIRGAEGMVFVSSDINPRNQVFGNGDLHHPSLPVFRISYAAADAILALDGLDVGRVREAIDTMEWSGRGWGARDLSARLRMELALGPPEEVTVYSVMGLLHGADAFLADEVVVVSCNYDGLGRDVDGTLYPGANENGSGVAVMLEIARLWQEQGFQPRRGVLFAAWGGGELRYSDAHGFVDHPGRVLGTFDISAVVHLDSVGGQAGEGLVIRQLGEQRNIFDLFVASASDMDVEIYDGAPARYTYQHAFRGEREPLYGGMIVTWGALPPALAEDTPDRINPDHLNQTAQAVNLTLITAAHEPRY